MERKIIGIEVAPGKTHGGEIQPVDSAKEAELWSVYRRDRYVTGVTLASGLFTFMTMDLAENGARELAKRYNIPYLGVKTMDMRET